MDHIDALFNHLALIYGTRFTHIWPVETLPQVKESWNRELSAFRNKPEAIQHALDNLPSDRVPTVLEIRDLCRRFTAPRAPGRISPMSAEERDAALELLQAFKPPGPQGARDWAHRLRAREVGGERLTLFQRACWREVLPHSEEK